MSPRSESEENATADRLSAPRTLGLVLDQALIVKQSPYFLSIVVSHLIVIAKHLIEVGRVLQTDIPIEVRAEDAQYELVEYSLIAEGVRTALSRR